MASPDSPAFWDERYRTGKTPWDYGGVPPEFANYLESRPHLGRVLVPGCGSGHEIRALLEFGADPTGLDLSQVAVNIARGLLGEQGGRVQTGDFFTHPLPPGGYDAVYERTFLCALPPDRWPDYAFRMAELLKPGGLLFGFFLFGDEPEPPPHPLPEDGDMALLGSAFIRIDSRLSQNPPAIFEGMTERWQIWQKKADAPT